MGQPVTAAFVGGGDRKTSHEAWGQRSVSPLTHSVGIVSANLTQTDLVKEFRLRCLYERVCVCVCVCYLVCVCVCVRGGWGAGG